jgi:hypothetical protein
MPDKRMISSPGIEFAFMWLSGNIQMNTPNCYFTTKNTKAEQINLKPFFVSFVLFVVETA